MGQGDTGEKWTRHDYSYKTDGAEPSYSTDKEYKKGYVMLNKFYLW